MRVPPWPDLDGGGIPPGQVLMMGVPEVPPTRTGRGTPIQPIRQSSIAGTCYAAGGMPLVFTQEDFLVFELISLEIVVERYMNSIHCLMMLHFKC